MIKFLRKRLFVTLIVFIAVLFSSAGTLAAEDVPAPYMMFALWGDLLNLYPEVDYYTFPSDLLSLHKPVLFNHVDVYSYEYETLSTRSPGYTGPGAAGGTYDSYSNRFNPLVSITGFYPLKNGMVMGAGGYVNIWKESNKETYKNYNANPESKTAESNRNGRQTYAANYYIAKKIGNIDFGINGAFNYYHQPMDESWTTDSSVNSGKKYITNGIGYPGYELNRDTISALVSAAIPFDKLSIKIASSVEYVSGYWNYFTAVDKDGNGYADAYVPTADYEKSTEAWGANPSGPYTAYAYTDTRHGTTVSFLPVITYDFSNSFSLLVNGSADVYSNNTNEYYQHFTAGDKSSQNSVSSDPGYEIISALIFKPSNTIEIRLGGGYAGENYKYTNNSVDYNGDSIFDPKNTNHYTEVNWTSDPDNGDVISNGSKNSGHSDTIKVLAGLQWNVSPKVVLFGRGVLSSSSTTRTYNVFNTADDNVWTETEQSESLHWEMLTITGAGITISDNLFLGLQTDYIYGDSNPSTDTLPTKSGKESTTAGSATVSYPKNNSFRINLYFVVGL